MGKPMCTKLSKTKTGVLRYLAILLISSNAFSFEKPIFEEINSFFEKVNSDLFISETDIERFNDQKINSDFMTKVGKINLPYFVFKAQRETNEFVLYIGGIHADEFAPLYFSTRYVFELLNNKSLNFQKNIIYIPLLNIDGFRRGIQKRSYPWRNNGENIDLNRSFYAYDELDQFTSNPENELVIDLIKKYQPKHWVIPHSSLNILDFDGVKDNYAEAWVRDVHLATSRNGGPAIPIEDFRDYAPPRSKKNWSIGKLASHLGDIYSLTFEFSGYGEYPSDNDPDRSMKIAKRKHLGGLKILPGLPSSTMTSTGTPWIPPLFISR